MVVKVAVPLLENGDHLPAHEFERRYNAMPSNIKAELLRGVVYISSTVRVEQHGFPHGNLTCWLSQYCTLTPGVHSPINSTIRFDDENQPQPDSALMVDPAKGGQA